MKKLLTLLAIFFMFFSCTKKNNLDEITIVLDWVPNTNHTGIFVAKDLGYFKEEGIDIKIVQPAEDSAATIVALGKAEFGVYFQPNLAKRLLKNAPITAVAAILQHNTAGLMTLKKTNAKSPKDLKDKRFSTWEDYIDDATVEKVVASKLIKIPGETTDATSALEANLFDYIMVYYGWDYINAKIRNVDVDFFFLKDYEEKFDYYSPIIIANNDFLKEKEELSRKTLRALKKGYEFAAKNPEKASDILLKNAPELNKELVYESQKYLSKNYLDENSNFGYIDIKRWDAFYNWLYEEKLIDTKFESGAGFTNEYLEY